MAGRRCRVILIRSSWIAARYLLESLHCFNLKPCHVQKLPFLFMSLTTGLIKVFFSCMSFTGREEIIIVKTCLALLLLFFLLVPAILKIAV